MGQIITVNFRNDTLFAVQRDDGVFVAVKPICDSLGIEWRKQQERLKRDPILAEGITTTVMPSPGGAQETTLLKLELLNGLLFSIDESRVKPEAKERVLAYKRGCYAVLYRHFHGRSTTDFREPPVAPLAGGKVTEKDPVRMRRQLVTVVNQIFGPKAARELYFKLGLDTVPAMFEPTAAPEFAFTYTAVRIEPPKSEEAA